eukprot:2336718-Amphidinium_carterae.2
MAGAGPHLFRMDDKQGQLTQEAATVCVEGRQGLRSASKHTVNQRKQQDVQSLRQVTTSQQVTVRAQGASKQASTRPNVTRSADNANSTPAKGGRKEGRKWQGPVREGVASAHSQREREASQGKVEGAASEWPDATRIKGTNH